MTREEWVKPGTKVASVGIGQHKSVTYSKINRIGRTWIILDNEERFHVLGLDRVEGGLIGGRQYRLYKAEDPKVREVELDLGVRKVMKDAVQKAKDFSENPTVSNAEEVVLACLPFTQFVIESNTE